MKKVLVCSCILFTFMFCSCKKDQAQVENGEGSAAEAQNANDGGPVIKDLGIIKKRTCSARGNYNGMRGQTGKVEVPFETTDEVAVQTEICHILSMTLQKHDDDEFISDCIANTKIESIECSDAVEKVENCQVVGDVNNQKFQFNGTLGRNDDKDKVLKPAACDIFCDHFDRDTPKDECTTDCMKNGKVTPTCYPVCRAVVHKKDTTLEIKVGVENEQDRDDVVKSAFCKEYCSTFHRAIGFGRLMPMEECKDACKGDAEIRTIECGNL